METKQIQKLNINKIADRVKKNQGLQFYFDYQDTLTDEQVLKIIKEEEGLSDIENEVWENNQEYIWSNVDYAIDEELTEEEKENLTEEEKQELHLLCEEKFELDINDLLKHSEIRLRVTLETNEDMIYFGNDKNIKDSETIKEFKRVFRKKYKKEDWENELNNVFDYGNFTFFFKVNGENILKLREEILKGYITLKKGFNFGFFNSCIGGGSVLEMELLNNITLNLKDWRLKNKKDEVINNLKEKQIEGYGYWEVSIKGDNISKYGINEIYGLTGECWVDW